MSWVWREYKHLQGVILGVFFILGSLGIYLWPDAQIQSSTFKYLSAMFGIMLFSGFVGLFFLVLKLIHHRKFAKLGIPYGEEKEGVIFGTTILDDELELILKSDNQLVEVNSREDGRKLKVCIGYEPGTNKYFLIVENKEMFEENESRQYFSQIEDLRREMKNRTGLVPEMFVER